MTRGECSPWRRRSCGMVRGVFGVENCPFCAFGQICWQLQSFCAFELESIAKCLAQGCFVSCPKQAGGCLGFSQLSRWCALSQSCLNFGATSFFGGPLLVST